MAAGTKLFLYRFDVHFGTTNPRPKEEAYILSAVGGSDRVI